MDDHSLNQPPNGEALIVTAQQAAASGKPFHEILVLLRDTVEPARLDHIPFVVIEWCLTRAFAIPLRDARDIERWNGFSDRGDWTNAIIDAHFAPWLIQYQREIAS